MSSTHRAVKEKYVTELLNPNPEEQTSGLWGVVQGLRRASASKPVASLKSLKPSEPLAAKVVRTEEDMALLIKMKYTMDIGAVKM